MWGAYAMAVSAAAMKYEEMRRARLAAEARQRRMQSAAPAPVILDARGNPMRREPSADAFNVTMRYGLAVTRHEAFNAEVERVKAILLTDSDRAVPRTQTNIRIARDAWRAK